VRGELVEKGDGIPLFIEELAHALLAAGDGSAHPRLPNTLRGLLMSRLDSVGRAPTDSLHLAAALGRRFSSQVLAAAASRPTAEIVRELHELQRAGLLSTEGGSDGQYAFRHALVQEAVYDSMVRAERQLAHRRIAQGLLSAARGLIEERPELLAYHSTEAGSFGPAIEQWHQAGIRAISRGAYREAMGHLDRALSLVDHLGSSLQRHQTELALLESQGTALFSSFGYADPRVEEVFRKAFALCELLGGDVPHRTLYGLWSVQLARGAREEVDALLPMFAARARGGDPVGRLNADACAGLRAFLQGDFAHCVDKMNEAMRWYSSPEYTAFVAKHGYEGGLYLPAYRMWSTWILGQPDRAQLLALELESLASKGRVTPYGHCIAAGYRIFLARDRREHKLVVELASEQIAHAERQLIYLWQAPAHCSRGWAIAQLGGVAAGIAEIRAGLGVMRAGGLVTIRSYHSTALAEALLLAGEADEALAVTREGLALCASSVDAFCEAELRRLEGEALLALGRRADAESSMRAAFEVATRQGALSYALRAATSLAHAALASGDRSGARVLLAPVYGRFSEGFDTGDLRAARALLDQLE
jgi:tetratricopeptide (TPR) repeat protein